MLLADCLVHTLSIAACSGFLYTAITIAFGNIHNTLQVAGGADVAEEFFIPGYT